MRRVLFNVLTILSLALCLLAVVLWWRASTRMDTIVIRTWPSYSSGPDLKWVVLRTYDGWVISFHRRIVPRVDAGPPPWRHDVPLAFKRLVPPTDRNSHALSEDEYRLFHSAATDAYRGRPALRWETQARGAFNAQPGPMSVMPTWWTALGFKTYPRQYLINNLGFPGAYRDDRVGVPHAIVVGLSSLLPALWAGRFVRREVRAYLARRRVGLCRGCGYDLRESPERCPECGRPVDGSEASRAPAPPEEPRGPRPPFGWRWAVVGASAVVVVFAVVLAWAPDTSSPSVLRHWYPGPADAAPPAVPAPSARVSDGEGAPGAVAGAMRFEAVWAGQQTRKSFEWSSLAVFDAEGPLPGTVRPLASGVGQAAVDVAAKVIYASNGSSLIRSFDGRYDGSVGEPRGGFGRIRGLAFDTKRQRLVVAGGPPWGGSMLYLRAPDTHGWSSPIPLPGTMNVMALTYSAAEDCLYAVSAAAGGDPASIVRLTPEGEPEWRIPLAVSIQDVSTRTRASYQLAAAGSYLALVIGGDPYGRVLEPQRLIVIDPKAIRVVHKGVLREK